MVSRGWFVRGLGKAALCKYTLTVRAHLLFPCSVCCHRLPSPRDLIFSAAFSLTGVGDRIFFFFFPEMKDKKDSARTAPCCLSNKSVPQMQNHHNALILPTGLDWICSKMPVQEISVSQISFHLPLHRQAPRASRLSFPHCQSTTGGLQPTEGAC